MPLFAARDDAPAEEPVHTAPVAEPRAAMPAAPIAPLAPVAPAAAAADVKYELPIDALIAVADGAGLQWINSDAEKIRAVQEAIAAMPAPIHVPREIRKVALPDEGPLVLVETRKDLAQVRLPFESPSMPPSS